MMDTRHSLASLLASLGRDGREFERLCKWYLENDPQARLDFEHVWLWDEWPSRWGRDRGIDLVAQRPTGEIVAIQAKHYAASHSITKRDIDTFLSESNRSAVASRMLIGTTDRLSGSAREVMSAQEKPVVTCLLNDLLESRVSWPSSMDDLAPSPVPTAQPREHQLEALEAIERWHQDGPARAQVIMACGTGKTLVSIWAADRLGAERVVVLVPTIPLLRQTAREWTAQASNARRLLRICSDIAPGEETWDRGNELAVERTTDVSEIAPVLRAPGPLLVLCTYESSATLAEAMELVPAVSFDIAIADEAHRCAGLESRSHKTILRDDAIRADRRLFLTATPTLYGPDDKSRATAKNVALASMDDTVKFGPVIHHLSFGKAIERGLLCPYQVAVIPISDEEVRQMVERHDLVTPDGDNALDAASLATQIACARAMRRFGCRRMIAFHPLVESSLRFSEQFPRAVALLAVEDRPGGRLWSEHVDGSGMPYAKRAKIVQEFTQGDSDTYRLLSNVRLLAEGVDVPGIDAIAFVDTERGQTAIIQAVGRAVRPAPGKEIGTIVLPIVKRHHESFEQALARSEHRPIVRILGALRSHDQEIVKSLDDLRFTTGKDGRHRLPTVGRFVVDAPVEVGEEFANAIDVALANALGVTSKRIESQPRLIELRPRLAASTPTDLELRIDDGLRQIASLARHQILPRVPSSEDWPGHSRWWPDLMSQWAEESLDHWDRQQIANSISWLSPDFHDYPHQCDEIMDLTEVALPAQIAAQLRMEGIYRRGRLAGLAEEELGDDILVGTIESVHEAVTHAGMPAAMQVKLVRDALAPLADALVETDDLDYAPTYEWPSGDVVAVIKGFVYELALARVGEGDFPEPTRPLTRYKRAQALGAEAARPLTAQVRKLRPYRSSRAAAAVKHHRQEETDMAPDDRLDELGWEIFLLVLARGSDVVTAAQLAMDGTLSRREAVQCDLRARIERQLEGTPSHVP